MFLQHLVVCIVRCSAVKAVYIDYIMRTTGCSAVNVVYFVVIFLEFSTLQFFGNIPKNGQLFPPASGHPVCNLESL
jgi:hypothetical protein